MENFHEKVDGAGFKLEPFPEVDDDDIKEIRQMTEAGRQDLKTQINQYDLRNYFPLDRQGKGIVCPICGNGSGNTGDGIVPQRAEQGDSWHYWHHCFANKDFEGKLTDILSKIYSDYNRVLAVGKKMLNHEGDIDFKVPAQIEEISPAEKAIITADILKAQEHLTELPAEDRRGLTIETLKKFGCGYLASWIHPKHRLAEKPFPPSPRIIIPTSAESYDAILLKSARTEKTGKYKSMNAGRKNLFNKESISAGKNIIVVEGEIDAMSIWQAEKKSVVATGGVASYGKLLKYLDTLKLTAENKLDYAFVFLFDNDDAGRQNAKNAVGTFIKAGYPAASDFLSAESLKVDANDWIQQHGAESLLARLTEIETAAQNGIETAREKILERPEFLPYRREKLKQKIEEFEKEKADALDYLEGLTEFDRETLTASDTARAAAFAHLEGSPAFEILKARIKDWREDADKATIGINGLFAIIKPFEAEIKSRKEELNAEKFRIEVDSKIDKNAIAKLFKDSRGFTMPLNYVIDKRGVGRFVQDKKGGISRIDLSLRPFYVSNVYVLCENGETRYCADITTITGGGKIKTERQIDFGILYDARKVAALSSAGLAFTSCNAADIVTFIDNFIHLNDKKLNPVKLFKKLGWTKIDGKDIFVSPYSKQFVIEKSNTIARHLKTAGEPTEWTRLAFRLFEENKVGFFALSAAFASLMLKPLGVRNWLLYLRARSKSGKSALLNFIATGFGDNQFVKSFNATANSLETSLADVTPFPALFDERQVATANFNPTEMIYRAGQGISKGRCRRDGTPMEIIHWLLVSICAGEESLTENGKTQGIFTRTLEIVLPLISAELARAFHGIFNAEKNYGHAARDFINRLQRADMDALRKEYEELCVEFYAKYSDRIEDHCRYIAVTTIACRLVLEWLCGVDAIVAKESARMIAQEIFSLVPTQKALSDEEAEKALVDSWIAMNRLRFENGPIAEQGERLTPPISGGIYGDRVYIIRQALVDYLRLKGYSPQKVIDDLFQCKYFQRIDGEKTKVKWLNNQSERCLVVAQPRDLTKEVAENIKRVAEPADF